MTLDVIFLGLVLLSFPFTFYFWLRFFAWVCSLMFAGLNAQTNHPPSVRIATLNSSGLLGIILERGRGHQWLGFAKAFLWAAGSFCVTMSLALMLIAPQEKECVALYKSLELSVSQRAHCVWLIIDSDGEK